MAPEISVIVPVYNMERQLHRCIESILKQTYENYEIILVDDGSTDGSVQICDHYAAEKHNIQVIHKKNAGLPKARETGVSASLGNYICFIDSDDWVESDYLEKLYRAIKENSSDISCCGYYMEYDDGSGKASKIEIAKEQVTTSGKQCIKLLHDIESVYPYMWNKLYKRELFCNVEFPDVHTMSEDYFILIQILPLAKKVTLISDCLNHYMQSSESMCGSGFNKSYEYAVYHYKEKQAPLMAITPEYGEAIISYRVLQDMATITAMSRNANYDKSVLQFATADIKDNFKIYMHNPKVALYYKASAAVIVTNVKLFIAIYRTAIKFVKTRVY